MSLKDEIEKLIQQEQQKIEEFGQRLSEFSGRQRLRFQSFRTLLEEIVASVDTKHIEARISDERATLQVGKRKDGHFFTEIRWEIEPNNNGLLCEQPGYSVEETHYYEFPEYDVLEHKLVFNNEQETADHIVKKIAEKMAHYRHLDKLRAQSANNNKRDKRRDKRVRLAY